MSSIEQTINSVSFTPGGENLCVGTNKGFAVFDTNPLSLKMYRTFDGKREIGKVMTLPKSNIVIFTGVASHASYKDSCISVWENSIGRSILEVVLKAPISQIFTLSTLFGIATKNEVRLYTFNPPMLHMQLKSAQNDSAPCDITERFGHFLVGMTGNQPGNLRIVSGNTNDNQDLTIRAHNHPIAFIRFNGDGSFVASASNQGTCIRLFDRKTGDRLAEFRRGSFKADIQSLSFNRTSELLALTSSKGTVHVFPVVKTDINSNNPQRSLMAYKARENAQCSLVFADNKTLLLANSYGEFSILECDESNSTIVAKRTALFMNMLQQEK